MNACSPFDDLRAQLADARSDPGDPAARIDLQRRARCGIPEIVYCRGKSIETIGNALIWLVNAEQIAIGTQLDLSMANGLVSMLTTEGLQPEIDNEARTIQVKHENHVAPPTIGRVGILTAGSSDWPVAAEAKIVAELAGCEVISYRDVGVAGLHRLVKPLEDLMSRDPAALIVAAGMDGVLPSVVAGLVDVPIIGLPTSTGYGHGGAGEGALTTMLQSCAPGIAVVNIDNGVGAGAMAALIARQVDRNR